MGIGYTERVMHLPGLQPEPEETDLDLAEVEVRIRGLMLDPNNRSPIVVLNDLSGEVVLPIWVGLYEANAIALEIEKSTTPRPMTHDLLRDVVRGLNATISRVVVSALRDDTFHATVWLQQGSEPVAVDARPSDAIALALRADCPIFISRDVYEHARRASASGGTANAEELRRWLEGLGDDEMGRYKM